MTTKNGKWKTGDNEAGGDGMEGSEARENGVGSEGAGDDSGMWHDNNCNDEEEKGRSGHDNNICNNDGGKGRGKCGSILKHRKCL